MEPVPQPPQVPQPNRKLLWLGSSLAIIILVTILVSTLAGEPDEAAISPTGTSNQALSVYEVWLRAEELEGQVIRVQGKADFIFMMTALLCCPPRCDCNQTDGLLRLVSENPTRVNIDCAIVDLIEIDTPACQGDECSLTCTPFYPGEIEAFEFTGQLKVIYVRDHPCGLQLTNVDLSASQQFANGAWEPIPTGTFTVPLLQPTQDPSLCEGRENLP
jgi:hypothetical protein